MWQFLNQYGWYLLMFGLMIFMHRKGMGCCGGHQHDPKDRQEQPITKDLIPIEKKK